MDDPPAFEMTALGWYHRSFWRLCMSDRDSGNNFIWFLAGLGFGALVGVLYAPRSGRETRESLMNSAQEGREYIRTRGREARDSVNQWVDHGKEVVARGKEQFGSAVEATRQAYREATEGKKNS
jgi:gas vesicle protein